MSESTNTHPVSPRTLHAMAQQLGIEVEDIPHPDEDPERWAELLEQLRTPAPGIYRQVFTELNAPKTPRGTAAGRASRRVRKGIWSFFTTRTPDGELAPRKAAYLAMLALAAVLVMMGLYGYLVYEAPPPKAGNAVRLRMGDSAQTTAVAAGEENEDDADGAVTGGEGESVLLAGGTDSEGDGAGAAGTAGDGEATGGAAVAGAQATGAGGEEAVLIERPRELPRTGQRGYAGSDYAGGDYDALDEGGGYGGFGGLQIGPGTDPAVYLDERGRLVSTNRQGMVLFEQPAGGLGAVPISKER